MKHIIYFLAFIWAGTAIVIGTLGLIVVPGQIQKDEKFLKTVLQPPVEFIKNFKRGRGRLPSDEEFGEWFARHNNNYIYESVLYMRSANGISADDTYKFKNANWKKDFAVGAWRGEWEDYYFSWSDKYDVSAYTWSDAFFEFTVCLFIGALPLIIMRLIRSWKKRRLLQL